jgi:hypothetical protein
MTTIGRENTVIRAEVPVYQRALLAPVEQVSSPKEFMTRRFVSPAELLGCVLEALRRDAPLGVSAADLKGA